MREHRMAALDTEKLIHFGSFVQRTQSPFIGDDHIGIYAKNSIVYLVTNIEHHSKLQGGVIQVPGGSVDVKRGLLC